MSRKNNVNPDYYKVGGRDRVVSGDVVSRKGRGASKRDLERAAKARKRPREKDGKSSNRVTR